MKIIRSLAAAFGKADRRSHLLLSGITAITISALFVIMSLAKGRILAEDIKDIRKNGSAATAVLQSVSKEQYQQLADLNYISNVGVAKDFGRCYGNGRANFFICSVVGEADFLEIFSPAYEDLTGNYPQAADEVMLSLHILSDLGIEKPEIRMEIPLHIIHKKICHPGNGLEKFIQEPQESSIVNRLSVSCHRDFPAVYRNS